MNEPRSPWETQAVRVASIQGKQVWKVTGTRVYSPGASNDAILALFKKAMCVTGVMRYATGNASPGYA